MSVHAIVFLLRTISMQRNCFQLTSVVIYYDRTPRVGALSDDARLTSVYLSDVYLSCTSGLRRTERPRKAKIGTEVAHVTRDSDTTFKVKRSKINLQGAGAYCGGLPHSMFYEA